MRIDEMIYNQVLYNHRLKKLVVRLFQSSITYRNPLYNFLYDRVMSQKMKQFSKIPFRVMIENTNACHADCVFCPHKLMKRKVGVMSMDLYKKIIDQCQKFGIDYVTIYGFGEPLLDRYFFERVNWAKKADITRVTTNTNGMYLDKEKIEPVFLSGLDEIYISFDAATETTYKKIRPGLKFKTVEENILRLVKERKKRKLKKPEIILSYVECLENRHETGQYIKKWKDKVDFISISFIHNWTGVIQSGGKLKIGRRDPCRLLWTDMIISWNGDAPLCCNDYENRIILGNIRDQSIKKIWTGEQLKKIRKLHQKGRFEKILICKNCDYNFHHKSPWWVGK